MSFDRDLKNIKKVVIKIGSSTLADVEGLSVARVRALAKQIVACQNKGYAVVVVSSGAVAAGFKKMGLLEKPKNINLKQATAAVGQVSLMSAWDSAVLEQGAIVAQILLTAGDFSDRFRFLNAKNTLLALLEHKVIPIINENDTIAVDELKVGDNDTLGALVASMLEADLFINLTDIAGLYEQDPRKNPKAELINFVEKVNNSVLAKAGGEGSSLGTGGMYTKVRAAKRLSEVGISSVIANGNIENVILKILNLEKIGTFFQALEKPLKSKKHWLAFASQPKGFLVVDAGAEKALKKHGKSLLASGVIAAQGVFDVGDTIKIKAENGSTIALGLVNYNSTDIEKIIGLKSFEIEEVLGYHPAEEIVHRNNLVLAEGLV